MKPHSGHFEGLSILMVAALVAAMPVAQAAVGVREAAVGLERQLQQGGTASQSFQLPLGGSQVVLSGEAQLQAIEPNRCRRTLALVHDQPFERRGLRITNLSRRSVQDGPCHHFADAMAAQAEASAKSIAEQIGLAATTPDTTPGEQVLVAQAEGATPLQLHETATAPVTLIVREKAIIRDAPSRQGEKLSRADAGTPLKAWRIPGNAEWFALDGGLRFISASVVKVGDATAAPARAQGDASRLRLKVRERAVLRNAPSFKGQKVAQLGAGVERTARQVPGKQGWFELTDSDSRYPLYIHASVVSLKKI